MSTTADLLRALLTEQHNTLSQLEPSQQQLCDLALKLKGMSVEQIHSEITASFESAKKKHDDAVVAEQKVSRVLKVV